MEKVQKEIEQAAQDAGAIQQRAVDAVNPPESQVGEARWIVAQRKGTRVSTVVLVYPMPGLQRTAIQLVWDLTDYPSAWPLAER